MSSGEVAQESPRNIMKFLCSYGGKILPRPSDGNLKYVGGETRIVSVPRDITFSELLVKLRSLINGGDIVLKYKIISEDLDALVTVKSDEDLKHMRDEYDRHESQGILKLRTFLFQPNPVTTLPENQAASFDLRTVEQRYIDAINGVPRTLNGSRLRHVIANRPSFSISACSSPKSNSPVGNNHDLVLEEAGFSNGYRARRVSSMHRVRSSPSVYSLSSQPHQHYHQNHSLHQSHGYGSFRPSPPPDFSSKGGSSPGWGPLRSHGQNHYISASRHDSGGGGSGGRSGFYEDFSGYGNAAIDRSGRVPHSLRKHGLRP